MDKKERLVPDEDYEFEKSRAELERQRQQALEDAEQRAAEEAAAKEREEQRERDRQIAADRLELMKLKSGVIEESETIHEEHEEAPEMTKKQKLANFWYHYKIPVIFAVFLIAVVGFIVYDEVSRVRPDMTIMMIANNGLAYREQEMEEFFEKYVDDLNGDGKVNVLVMEVPLDSASNSQMQLGNQNKVVAQMQTGENIMVITDSNTDTMFLNMMKRDLDKDFPGNEYIDIDGLSLNFKFLAEELKFENMPNDIHLAMRIPIKTLSDSKEKMQENYDEAFVVFKRIVEDLTARARETNDPGLDTEPMHRDESSGAQAQ
ncbi:MAG: hypothetical protein IJ561_07245 [Ruminococcus sp.]|nr:hypothetical protein [Ruminococcus sp.]